MTLRSLGSVLVLLLVSWSGSAGTLEAVLERGYLKCGVQAGHPGFAAPDFDGVWQGFDVDFCRAVASAVLADANRVMYVSSDRASGVDSLRSGSVDLVARQAFTLERPAAAVPVRQVGILLHDSYGFLARSLDALPSAQALSGKTLCLVDVDDATVAVPAFLHARGIAVELSTTPSLLTARRRYDEGACDAVAGLRSDLAGIRARLDDPVRHLLLPEHAGKAPAGPAVLAGDKPWAGIVEWVLFALIEAEEIGLSSRNVVARRDAARAVRVRRLLGVEGDLGSLLGLRRDWGFQILRQVGSYAEIYARNIGPGTPLDLDRGLNRLWTQGGLLYAPPLTAH